MKATEDCEGYRRLHTKTELLLGGFSYYGGDSA